MVVALSLKNFKEILSSDFQFSKSLYNWYIIIVEEFERNDH